MRITKLTIAMIIMMLSCLTMNSTAQLKNGKNSVLWKVQYPGSSHISYLLGTNHFYGNEWINSFPSIHELILSSSTFICENALSLDSANNRAIQQVVLKETRNSKDLFKGSFDLVNTYFLKKTCGGIVENLDSTDRPKIVVLVQMFAYLLNEVATARQLKVSSTTMPMDYFLLKYASTNKKKCIGLDDISTISKIYTSKKLFDEISQGIISLVQISLDTVNVDHVGNEKIYKELVSLITDYNFGSYVYNFEQKSKGEAVETKERNKTWLKTIPKLMETSNCFIAVGNAHLDTRSGLIVGLMKKGFVVTPLMF